MRILPPRAEFGAYERFRIGSVSRQLLHPHRLTAKAGPRNCTFAELRTTIVESLRGLRKFTGLLCPFGYTYLGLFSR